MPATNTVSDGEFYQQFISRLNAIEARAKAAGITMTYICADCGISRATPERWRKAVPRTIEILDQMDECVQKVEREAARK